MTPVRDAILDHIKATTFDSLPADVVAATNVVIADTIACGFAGSAEPKAKIFRDIQLSHFGYGSVPVWGTGQLISPIGAGMANGYQVHCLEYACFHEAATVHSMSVILPTVMAYADRFGGVTGKDIITAVNIGNDVATLLGLAATKGARFFRPGVCGAMGAGAALAKLAGFDRPTTAEFFGLLYSQLSGTMQAHTEASMALGLQIAFSVRNALTALDMVRMHLTGPTDVFDGPYGYFKLFEVDGDAIPYLVALGSIWRTAEISFKPFPSGRASHGAIYTLQRLMQAHAFGAADVDRVTLSVPPFVHRLGGRPVKDCMDGPYARLCLPYLAASVLIDGTINVASSSLENFSDPGRLALAAKVSVEDNGNPDANALAPQKVSVILSDGRELAEDVFYLLGHPDNPMSEAQHQAKFMDTAASAAQPIAADMADTLYSRFMTLQDEADVSIVRNLAAGFDMEKVQV
ncbi:MAG: MmgE/PrpD family protein [Rhodospirillaceae bacterium]|nr:MmgE/PrpD family protein [Rhodospirillaceae bacterium]